MTTPLPLPTYDLPSNIAGWRAIAEDDRYEVNADGEVLSWTEPGRRPDYRSDTPRLLKPTVYPNGYRCIHVRISDGPRRLLYVHRLVAQAFLGAPPEGQPFACHIDGDRLNNSVTNLLWGSPAENQADMVRHGNSNRGERSHWAKLTESDVVAIRAAVAAGSLRSEVAEQFGISREHVKNIVTGYSWRHVA